MLFSVPNYDIIRFKKILINYLAVIGFSKQKLFEKKKKLNDSKDPRAPLIEKTRRDYSKNIYLDQARPKAETLTR
jgi:hypothetical protein